MRKKGGLNTHKMYEKQAFTMRFLKYTCIIAQKKKRGCL